MAFKFNGDWEFEYQFNVFKGLQSRRGSYTSKSSVQASDGTVNVTIMDELNDDTDPSSEQIAAMDYLSNNANQIRTTILKAVEEFYPKMKVAYGYSEDDEDFQKLFPKIDSLDGYSRVFGVGNVFVHISHSESIAYVGLECGCTWDEEHGLGIMLHKNKIIKIGAADEAFNPWTTYHDNGTIEQMRNRKKQSIPKKYKSHPKYNKLKPSQKDANDNFEYRLISQGYVSEFKKLVEAGEINVNDRNENRVNTFFEQACLSNNLELVKFMLQHGAEMGDGLHQCINGSRFNEEVFDYLLKNGYDINRKNSSGSNVLSIQCQELSRLYNAKKQYIEYGWKGVEKQDIGINDKKIFIRKLIKKGCNPDIMEEYGPKRYSIARNLPNELKKEMNEFIELCKYI